MKFRKSGLRATALGLLAMAGLALAPAASAHGGVSIGINVPGLSVGVGPHHHGYIGIGGPVYYAPTPAYYAPAPLVYDDYYYDAPVYVGGYYGGGYYHRYPHHHYHGGYDRYQYHYYHGGHHHR